MAGNGLTHKQQAFIEHYLDCLNASEAARRAKYAKPGQEGHRLLKNAEIAEAVQAGMKARTMSSDEVLARLTAFAVADVRQLMQFDDDGKWIGWNLAQSAPLHLIKQITPTRSGYKIELHDQMQALTTIARYHGLLTDRQEISGTITQKWYDRVSPDDWPDE